MQLHIIDTGYFYADGGAMFGAIPKSAWSRRYPCDDTNSCILAIRSLLVKCDDGHIILIDNGIGNKHLKQLSFYRFFKLKDLKEELSTLGIQTEDVTDVVFTHLHFDHCGYTTQHKDSSTKLSLAFPNAKHWVSREQWYNFIHPNPLEKGSYFLENMKTAEDAGALKLLDNDTFIYPEIELRLFDGHTPGQIAPYIYTPEHTFIFAGDVIPLIANLSPEWISAYDTFPIISYQEKTRMLHEAAEQKQIIIYCHDAYTRFSTVKQINNYFKKGNSINPLNVFHK